MLSATRQPKESCPRLRRPLSLFPATSRLYYTTMPWTSVIDGRSSVLCTLSKSTYRTPPSARQHAPPRAGASRPVPWFLDPSHESIPEVPGRILSAGARHQSKCSCHPSLGLLEASGRPELVPRGPDRVMLPGLGIGAARGAKSGYPWNIETGLSPCRRARLCYTRGSGIT